MKVGYMHYDGGSGTNLPFKIGLNEQLTKFQPDFMQEGGPNAALHIFGATSIPLDINFDYQQLDVDLVYFWLQGGVGPELSALKKFRRATDAVFVLFLDDVYWLEKEKRKYYLLTTWKPIADQMDAVSSGYINDEENVSPLLNKPWRYLPYPHDIPYYKQFYKRIDEKDNTFFSMIHGRMTECKRTIMLYKALHDRFPEKKYIIHPYRFYTKEQVLKKYPFDWLGFTPVVDNWFELLGKQRVQIDEYPCQSQSQVVTQAACFGTPTISHGFNAPNKVCFPKLTFLLNNIQQWYSGALILENSSVYEDIQKYAFNAVEDYNFEKFRMRIMQIYKEFKR